MGDSWHLARGEVPAYNVSFICPERHGFVEHGGCAGDNIFSFTVRVPDGAALGVKTRARKRPPFWTAKCVGLAPPVRGGAALSVVSALLGKRKSGGFFLGKCSHVAMRNMFLLDKLAS